jgi:hypothetical protein
MLMISQELLDILRCPLDPKRQSTLTPDGTALVCTRCGIRYPIKDGFPVLVVEEAELPAGCESPEQLAGRHETSPTPAP